MANWQTTTHWGHVLDTLHLAAGAAGTFARTTWQGHAPMGSVKQMPSCHWEHPETPAFHELWPALGTSFPQLRQLFAAPPAWLSWLARLRCVQPSAPQGCAGSLRTLREPRPRFRTWGARASHRVVALSRPTPLLLTMQSLPNLAQAPTPHRVRFAPCPRRRHQPRCVTLRRTTCLRASPPTSPPLTPPLPTPPLPSEPLPPEPPPPEPPPP